MFRFDLSVVLRVRVRFVSFSLLFARLSVFLSRSLSLAPPPCLFTVSVLGSIVRTLVTHAYIHAANYTNNENTGAGASMKARGWLTGGVVVVPYVQRDCHRHL